MTQINFEAMNGPELVNLYNDLVKQGETYGITWNTTTKRFADRASAEKRITKLMAEIKTKQDEGTVHVAVPEVTQNTLQPAPAGNTDTQAASTAPAEETAPAAAGPENNTASEEQTPADESEDDMAKRKKAATGGKKKGKARSTGGTTIRELTEEFNRIVAKMNKVQKEAAPWAKHHTSLFESKDKAKVQMAKLKKAIA